MSIVVSWAAFNSRRHFLILTDVFILQYGIVQDGTANMGYSNVLLIGIGVGSGAATSD